MNSSEAIIAIVIVLLLVFVWADLYEKDFLWKWIHKGIDWLDCFYRDLYSSKCIKLPEASVPMYPASGSHHNDSPCKHPYKADPCRDPLPCGNSICDYQTSVIFGCYKYCLDVLPGIIYSYRLDPCNGSPIPETRSVITHNLGILKKIYIKNGKIFVEDSYSEEHEGTVDLFTGSLNF